MKCKKATAILFLSLSLSACGKQQPVEISAEAEVETEESEVEEEETEEETAETSNYTGYSHYIDPKEAAAKAAESASEKEEEEQSAADDEVDGTEVAASETKETEDRGETKVAEQTETVAPASETASVSAQETYTDTIPETITMDPNFVKCSMYVVYDTQVKDAPYATSGNQGLIARGSNIGVMERCIETGYYRVNYGAKAGYLPPDALSMEDPFK